MLIEAVLSNGTHPYEDDTATSLIRREGFPPVLTQHHHIPHAYGCPCCNNLSPRKNKTSAHEAEAEADRRRRLQWDVLEERAVRPTGASREGPHRHVLRRFYATLQRPLVYHTRTMFNPPAPPTVDALRGRDGRAKATDTPPVPLFPQSFLSDRAPFVMLTIHQGIGFGAFGQRPHGFQVQVRYGSVGGLTQPSLLLMGGDVKADGAIHWDESFALPLEDLNTPIELYVIDADAARARSALDGAYLIAHAVIAAPTGAPSADVAWKQFFGDHADIDLTRLDKPSHHSTNGSQPASVNTSLVSETRLVVSWEVVEPEADEPTPEAVAPVPVARSASSIRPTAEVDVATGHEVNIVFEIDRIEVYRHQDISLLPGSLLCMLRRPDGECSDYVALNVSSKRRTLYNEGDDTGRMCTITCTVPPSTSTDETSRVLQVLVCRAESDVDTSALQEGAPLEVIGSTALVFTSLNTRGAATYILDSVEEVDGSQSTPFGEVSVRWTVTPVDEDVAVRDTDDTDDTADDLVDRSVESSTLDPDTLDSDVLSVTVVRGIDLQRPLLNGSNATDRLNRPLVAVAAGPLLASTPITAVRHSVHPRAPCNVVWNQELLFPLPSHVHWNRSDVELILQEGHEIVSVGSLNIGSKIAKINSVVEGGIVEGFEVVPLTQQGHTGSLGHLLVRWRYIAHNQLAHQARKNTISTAVETENATSFVDDTSQTFNEGDDASPHVAHNDDFHESPRLMRAASTTSSRSLPPRTRFSDGRRASAGSVPMDHSPFGKHDSVYHIQPHHDHDSDAATTPRRSSHHSQGGVDVEEDDCDEDVIMGGSGMRASSQLHASSRRSSSRRASSVRSAEGNEALEDMDGSEIEFDCFDETANNADEDPTAATEAPRPVPPPAPFVFRVRQEDGKPTVRFMDPAQLAAEAAAASVAPEVDPSVAEGLPPPINAPIDFNRNDTQWSSQLERDGGTKDPRQLLREELEVQYKAGQRAPKLTTHPWLQSAPWYPPGESRDETHVPLSRRESERKQLDAIVELRLKNRYVAGQSAARERRTIHDVSRSTSVATTPRIPFA